jgi:HK97 gp10 family phage protein
MAFEVKNVDSIVERIGDVADIEKMKKQMGMACALVVRSAVQKIRKGSGELQRSITSKVDSQDGNIIGTVYTPLEYAPYVEFGTGLFAEQGGRKDVPWHYKDDKGEWHTTSGQTPKPFLRPALNDNREQITRLLREGIGDD